MKKQEVKDTVKIYVFKNSRYLDSVDFYGIASNPLVIMENDSVVNEVSFFYTGICVDSNKIMKLGENDEASIYRVSTGISYEYHVVTDIKEIKQLIDPTTIHSIEFIGVAKVYKSAEEIDAEIERMRIG